MVLKYGIAWFGMMILAVVNGSIRDFTYKPHLGDLLAHQISTVALLVVFTFYFWILISFGPIESALQAWTIGGLWVIMTLVFEFGVGRFISGNPWSKLLDDYNLFAGRIWVFIPIWILIAPYILFRFRHGN